jgi:hypothetical protein
MTDTLVERLEALDPNRYVEGIGSQKWLDACYNMAPHAYKLRDQLKALQRSNAEKDGLLTDALPHVRFAQAHGRSQQDRASTLP